MKLDRHMKRFLFEVNRSRPHDKELVRLSKSAIYNFCEPREFGIMTMRVYSGNHIDKVKDWLRSIQPTFDYKKLVKKHSLKGGEK